MDLTCDFVAGTIGGAAGMLVEYPFDTVKVLLQTYGDTRYRGYLDCIQTLYTQEGIQGFFRGVTARLAASGLEHACIFVAYKSTLRCIGADDRPTVSQIATSGAIAGVASAVSLTPFELVKCRLQADAVGGQRLYRGSWDCATQVLRQRGWRGLYQGAVATLYREVPGTVAWCGTYDVLRGKMSASPEAAAAPLPLMKSMLAGGCSGIAFWTTVYPVDVVKTRIQVDASYQKMGFLAALSRVYQVGGMKALYRGWSMTAARSIPSNAVIFAVFDWTSHALQRLCS